MHARWSPTRRRPCRSTGWSASAACPSAKAPWCWTRAGSWKFTQFFRMRGTGGRVFVRRMADPLPVPLRRTRCVRRAAGQISRSLVRRLHRAALRHPGHGDALFRAHRPGQRPGRRPRAVAPDRSRGRSGHPRRRRRAGAGRRPPRALSHRVAARPDGRDHPGQGRAGRRRRRRRRSERDRRPSPSDRDHSGHRARSRPFGGRSAGAGDSFPGRARDPRGAGFGADRRRRWAAGGCPGKPAPPPMLPTRACCASTA